jgi:AIPR protein.
MNKYFNDFSSRDDLKKYGPNALLLYALQLRFHIDDIGTVASDSITDGYEDKKCDMVYIDSIEGVAVVAQAYYKQNFREGEHAKLTKAQDLNTAASWILGREIEDVPELLKSAVSSLREAIEKEEITTLYFWYQHNCDENEEIKNELNTVVATGNALLSRFFPEKQVNIIGLEVGNNTLEKWYNNTTNKILVNDDIEIELPFGGYEIIRDSWSAYQAYISGRKLHELYNIYNDDLFSANPRRFLGVGKKTNIINLGIKESAKKDADNFWAYNNGITALVHEYDCADAGKLKITGISIINGAQTTGSIGSLPTAPTDNLYISMRVIKCSDQKTIDAIIANNNRQNDMVPSDFRSNDICQTRLRNEFLKYPQIYYNGGQRNSTRPRTREVFDPDTVAQTLLSFNGNPVDAYSSKREVWSNDMMYASIFNDELDAEHIIFVYSLSKAIDDAKSNLQKEVKEGKAIAAKHEQLKFLCRRGSRILLLAAVSSCLEIIMQQRIISANKVHFDNNRDFGSCKQWWRTCIDTALSFYVQLVPALSAGGLDSKSKAENAINQFVAMMNAVVPAIDPQLKELRTHTLIS